MRDTLASIATGFEDIKTLRSDVVGTVDSIEQRVVALRKAHEALVASSPKAACTLGLDSLHFQTRLVSMELDSLRAMLAAIENHLYYECVSLHRLIQAYARDQVADSSAREKIITDREYPTYKHLDQTVRYDFDVTVSLHAQLITSLCGLSDYSDEQEAMIETEKGKTAQGLNIDSLVHSNTYVHAIVLAKVHLFCDSLAAFNGHHAKYLRRVGEKAGLVLDAISKDVRLAGPTAVEGGGEEGGGAEPEEECGEMEDTVGAGPRLTEAQRARKRKKQKKMRQRQQERRDSGQPDSAAPGAPSTEQPSDPPSSTGNEQEIIPAVDT